MAATGEEDDGQEDDDGISDFGSDEDDAEARGAKERAPTAAVRGAGDDEEEDSEDDENDEEEDKPIEVPRMTLPEDWLAKCRSPRDMVEAIKGNAGREQADMDSMVRQPKAPESEAGAAGKRKPLLREGGRGSLGGACRDSRTPQR